jgi:hypothetical protein
MVEQYTPSQKPELKKWKPFQRIFRPAIKEPPLETFEEIPAITPENTPTKSPEETTIFQPPKEPQKKTILESLGDIILDNDEEAYFENQLLTPQQITKPIIDGSKDKIISGIVNFLFKENNRLENKLIKPIKIEKVEGFDKALLEKMGPNTLLMAGLNHWDHANILEAMVASLTITNIINEDRKKRNEKNYHKNNRLIVAKSLGDGKQNILLQRALELIEKSGYLSKFYMSTEPCVTKNDMERRNMVDANGLINAGFLRHIVSMSKAGNEGLFIFIEGSVDGGRFTNRKRNGARHPLEDLDQIITLIKERVGKEILYLPIGLRGKNRIHTDHKFPTIAALKALLLDRNPESLATIKLGIPMTHTEIVKKIQEEQGKENVSITDVKEYWGKSIAELVPEDFQGVYRKK